MEDYFGLQKVDKMFEKLSFKSLNEKKLEETRQRKSKFFKPKPKYTHQAKPDYSKEIKELKAIAKGSGKYIEKLADSIKNRRIHKLEKEALKAKARSDQLAHEIKTKQAIIDSLTDIQRYKKEKEKTDKELNDMRKNK